MSRIITRDMTIRGGAMSFHLSTSGSRDRQPVLWLHGSGPGVTALTNWEAALDEHADDFYNVAPDIIGFGDSTHPNPPPGSLKAFTELRVATLVELLNALDIDQVDLVGNSMGGVISICMAIIHPERVRRIILMGSGGAPVPMTSELKSLITFYANPTVESMAALMGSFVVDQDVFGDRLLEIAAERMRKASRPDVERSHRATFVLGEPLPINAETLATIRQPVLIVHGDQDRIMPLAHSEWYHQHLPSSRLEVIDNAGHWIQIEHHDRFARLVRQFLSPKERAL